MTNDYKAAETIETGRAQDLLLDYKYAYECWIDNLGVIFYADALTLDDFDE